MRSEREETEIEPDLFVDLIFVSPAFAHYVSWNVGEDYIHSNYQPIIFELCNRKTHQFGIRKVWCKP